MAVQAAARAYPRALRLRQACAAKSVPLADDASRRGGEAGSARPGRAGRPPGRPVIDLEGNIPMSVLTAPAARPDSPASPPGPPKLPAAELRRAQSETLRTPRFRVQPPRAAAVLDGGPDLRAPADAAQVHRA